MKTQKYLESKPLSWMLFFYLFLMYATVYMTKCMFSSAMATIVEQGFMTKSQTGLINAMFWLVYAVFQVIGGFASDKFSSYKIIMIGLAGAIASNVVIYFNQSYPVMMAAWVFNGMIQFGLWPGVFKIISTQIRPSIRGTAVFWMLFATSVGLGLSMLVASFVSDWKDNFLVSIISLLIFMAMYPFVNHITEKNMVEVEVKEETRQTKTTVDKAPILPLIFSSGLIVFMVVCLLRVAIDNGIKMMTPVMLMECYKDLPAAISTRLSTILIVFSALGTLFAGFVQNKITKNEALAQVLLYFVSVIPLTVALFVGSVHYLWILLALSVAVVLVHGASAFSQTYVSLRFEKYGRIGTVSGILNAMSSIGNVFASYIFAKLAELIPWQGVTFSWLATIVFCGVICAIILPRWKKFTK